MTIFISHSHFDRAIADEIDTVLRENGAETYFDQRELGPAHELPEEIKKGIQKCGLFVLLWSAYASESSWVQKEWNLAYNERKKIVPFIIDGTGLPSPLDNFVYVDREDRKRAYSSLLTA